ncbi:alpha,alpha-trehalose-phosphate synthase (UDP-forming) [Roseibium limicola]|uniref:Trehalose-6-phosphate synthase n=1 Tax=Roseibium limicola TaxID=2816037 RepID=A0A939EUH3_9HYPH|nr:trehalose-6-phosphate synthase [Roseibium limicola]MBO0347344.1 trehalose-6-phosphate synthase [Roseibium limicola]
MSRLVVVSNRMPLGSNPSGGLVVALQDAMEKGGGLWIGVQPDADVLEGAEPAGENAVSVPGANFDRVAAVVPASAYDDYYLGYANSVLWPLCHGRMELIEQRPHYRAAYEAINSRLAKVVARFLRPDDILWVHDYHHLPLAAALRAEGVQNAIGFFLHIPFPTAANIHAVTGVEDVMSWISQYDLVGLQTQRDVSSAMDVFRQFPDSQFLMDGSLRFRNRTFEIKSFPIGIDAAAFRDIAARSRARLAPRARRWIIGAERLDYSKGLPHRLRAFGKLLETEIDLQGAVSFLQIASPTREDVQAYREIREELEQLSGAVNGRFSDINYTPIQYLNRGVPRDRLAGLFRQADVGLVTPLADGMNLVAKEYVAAQDAEDPGVLVLSGFAGAHEQLGQHALIANPYDIEQMARTIAAALLMPLEERIERHQAMLRIVMEQDVAWWSESFLNALEAKRLGSEFLSILKRLPDHDRVSD